MQIISIDGKNVDNEHICCALGNDQSSKTRSLTKKDWLKERFKEGLVFKRFDERGKNFIEYMPIEYAWKPLLGQNYLVIHCLWVSGKFKGKGYAKQLLEECISDAKRGNKDGIAVVTTSKISGFTTDKKFFLKFGFEEVDTAKPNFVLLALRFNKAAKTPNFTPAARLGTCSEKRGFVIMFTNQCPFAEEYANNMAEIIRQRNQKVTMEKISDSKALREKAAPFGSFGVYYKGHLIGHEIMPKKELNFLLNRLEL